MKLYLYKSGEKIPTLEITDVVSYTSEQVTAADGTVYSPLAEGMELSATPDCAETLRADWRRDNPSEQRRLEELEALMAQLLFGGDIAGEVS